VLTYSRGWHRSIYKWRDKQAYSRSGILLTCGLHSVSVLGLVLFPSLEVLSKVFWVEPDQEREYSTEIHYYTNCIVI
jgi:hypothetical protein